MAEHTTLERLFDPQNQKEGMQAFMEKRKPAWQGR